MKNSQSEYWDNLAKLGPEASVIDPNDSKGFKNNYIKTIRDKSIINGLKPLESNSYILDFGCGSGNVSRLLSNLNYRIHGVDISSRLIDLAKDSCDPKLCTFTHYDGKIIPTKPDKYQGSVIYVVLSYIVKEDDLKNTLSQIFDSMDNSSRFVVIEQTRRKTKLLDRGFKIQRTKNEYIKIFKNAGFNLERITDLRAGHYPMLYFIRYGLISKKYFSVINYIEQKLLKTFPTPLFDYRETLFIFTKNNQYD